jgi:hypothetical protein
MLAAASAEKYSHPEFLHHKYCKAALERSAIRHSPQSQASPPSRSGARDRYRHNHLLRERECGVAGFDVFRAAKNANESGRIRVYSRNSRLSFSVFLNAGSRLFAGESYVPSFFSSQLLLAVRTNSASLPCFCFSSKASNALDLASGSFFTMAL